ncbi:MAG: hypothetical protein L6246_04240 [Thermodesulfovibrionales bacterium]|nr:hypothetical protein [Nitrospinota bacterium]MCG2709517.1 hypothetical protein [Thermodesulfovibrionales bacterium]
MKRRENLAKAIYDIGKLAFAALVLGQIISPQGVNVTIFTLGAIFVVTCFILAYNIDRHGGNNG